MRLFLLAGIILLSTGGAVMSAESWLTDAVKLNMDWGEKAFNTKPSADTPGLAADTGLPFSFVYGGKPSSEFIRSWKVDVSDEKTSGKIRRTLTFTDPETGLEVKAVADIYTDTPGVDWIIYFSNKGTRDTPIIEKVSAVDNTFRTQPNKFPILHRMKGNVTGAEYSPEDFLPFDVIMYAGKKTEFGPSLTLSSETDFPFFNLQWDGGGVVTAVGWTGHWGSTVEHKMDNTIRMEAGMRDIKLRLHPGETIRSPRILQVHWAGSDQLRSYNLFRRTMFAHIMPRIKGELVVPPINHATNVFYSQNSGTEKEILEYLDSFKGLGFEYLWLDAFYMKDGWPNGVGNYTYPMNSLADPVRYPNGVKSIAEAAHKEGLGFLLWTAPERACKGTYLYEKHPEWLLGFPDQQTKLYDMGNPDAREYMTKYLIDLVNDNKMDCLRFDCGALIGELRMKDATEQDRSGMAEIRYHEGLYKMWDDILAACPNTFIDNCCGGGNRIDLETCARSLPLWRTDGVGYTMAVFSPPDYEQTALQNQVISAGMNRYMPFNTSGQMGTSPYLIRSAFNAGLVFCQDTRAKDYPKAELKEAIAEGKRIRKYFFGDFYPLNEITASPQDWCVLQYNRSDKQDGMVMAFRRHKSPYAVFACSLYDIDPDADYRVTYSRTYHPEKPVFMKGSDLQKLRIQLDNTPESVIIEYRKMK
ncbi:MAG: alpha-galactosidase [Armatimonadota bacterium]